MASRRAWVLASIVVVAGLAAGNTPTIRARVGQDVAFHVFGGDAMLHEALDERGYTVLVALNGEAGVVRFRTDGRTLLVANRSERMLTVLNAPPT